MADSGFNAKDLILIGGVAALGIGAYSLFRKSNNVTVTPSQDWDQINNLISQLKDSNNNAELLTGLKELLGTSNPNITVNVPGGSGTTDPLKPNTQPGSSGGGGSSDISKEDLDQTLDSIDTALNKMGYSGQWVKSAALVEESRDNDRISQSESAIGNFLWNTPGVNYVTNAVNLTGHAIHGTGEWIYNKLTGRDDLGNKL